MRAPRAGGVKISSADAAFAITRHHVRATCGGTARSGFRAGPPDAPGSTRAAGRPATKSAALGSGQAAAPLNQHRKYSAAGVHNKCFVRWVRVADAVAPCAYQFRPG